MTQEQGSRTLADAEQVAEDTQPGRKWMGRMKWSTVRRRRIETGISEASKWVSIFSFVTQGGKQVSFYFRQGNWVQAQDAQIRFPAG